jgi:hypothetical protein
MLQLLNAFVHAPHLTHAHTQPPTGGEALSKMRTTNASKSSPLDGPSQESNPQPNDQSEQSGQPTADTPQAPSKPAPEVKAPSNSASPIRKVQSSASEQKNAKSLLLPPIYDIFPADSEPISIARTCEAIAEKTGQSKAAYAIIASLFKSGAANDAAKIGLERVTMCVKDMIPLWFAAKLFLPTPRRWTLVPEHKGEQQHSGANQQPQASGVASGPSNNNINNTTTAAANNSSNKNPQKGKGGSESHAGAQVVSKSGDGEVTPVKMELPKRLKGLLQERKMALDALIQDAETSEIQSVRIHARKMRKHLRVARHLARAGDGESACLELEKAHEEMKLAAFAQSYNASVCERTERGVYADTRAILLSRAYEAASVYCADKAQAAVNHARKYLHPKDDNGPALMVQACEAAVSLLKAGLHVAITSTVAHIVDTVALQQDARTNALVLICDLREKYALTTQNVDRQWVVDSEKDILLRAEADLDAARDLCTQSDREELRMVRAQRAALIMYADVEEAIRQADRLARAGIDNIVSLRLADGYLSEAVHLCTEATQNQALMDPGELGSTILVTSRKKLAQIAELLRHKRLALNEHHVATCLHVVVKQVEEQQEAEASLNLTQRIEGVLAKAQEEFVRARYAECLETIEHAKGEFDRGFWREQVEIFPRIIDLQDRAQVYMMYARLMPLLCRFLFLYVCMRLRIDMYMNSPTHTPKTLFSSVNITHTHTHTCTHTHSCICAGATWHPSISRSRTRRRVQSLGRR